jgi:hypothetical protein
MGVKLLKHGEQVSLHGELVSVGAMERNLKIPLALKGGSPLSEVAFNPGARRV